MFVGSNIFYLDGNPYYSPEFPRGGLAATFSVDVTHFAVTGATDFLITVEHRNSEDQTFSSVGSFSAITGVGTASADFGTLKEIVRFKYEMVGGTPVASDAAHFLMMAPSWRPY